MKTMFYTNGRDVATIKRAEITGQDFFLVNYLDGQRGSRVSRYLVNFWEAEAVLHSLGYTGEKDAEYKGIQIRWREPGLHNVADICYKWKGYYEYCPPFPGTIIYWAASIPEAQAEIDRLETIKNTI